MRRHHYHVSTEHAREKLEQSEPLNVWRLGWLAVAVFFATVQITDICMFGWAIYDHLTSWAVTSLAVFYLVAAAYPRAGIWCWHFSTTLAHFVALAITIIIAHEPAHFMALARESEVWIVWPGHILLHLAPLWASTIFYRVYEYEMLVFLRDIPFALYLFLMNLPIILITVYDLKMHPATRYGTSLPDYLAFIVSGVLSIGVAEFGSGGRILSYIFPCI